MKKMKKLLLSMMFLCGFLFLTNGISVNAAANVTRGSYTYFAEDGTLYKMQKKTGKVKKIKTFSRSNTIDVIGAKGSWLYLTVDDYFCKQGTDNSWPTVCRVKTNGKNLQTLSKGTSPVLHGNYIYFINCKYENKWDSVREFLGIYRMNLNGKNKKKLFADSSATYYQWLKVANNRLYFCYRTDSGSAIYSSDMNGQDLQYKLDDNFSSGFYFYKNKMYTSQYVNGSYYLYEYDLETGALVYLYEGNLISGYKNTLYYTKGSFGNYKLYRYNLSTGTSKYICKRNMIHSIIGGDKWLIMNYYRGNTRYNTGVDRININGKKKLTIKKYYRS